MFKFLRGFFSMTEEEQYQEGWEWAKSEVDHYGVTKGVAHVRANIDNVPDRSEFDKGAEGYVHHVLFKHPPVARTTEEMVKISQLDAVSEIRLIMLDEIGNEPFYNIVDDLVCKWYSERIKRAPVVDI
jgi:hypothetical protein